MLGVSLFGGIGFTVSLLLICDLAFGAGSTADDHVKVAILTGSLAAGLLAAVLVKSRATPSPTNSWMSTHRPPAPRLFALMWGGSMLLTKTLNFDYQRATAVSFTAAGNNFDSPSPWPPEHGRGMSPASSSKASSCPASRWLIDHDREQDEQHSPGVAHTAQHLPPPITVSPHQLPPPGRIP